VRFAIVRALFNGEITAALLAGAVRAFADAQVHARDVDVFEVPGSFELPLCSLWCAQTRRYDAIVCLGCVIRGATPHFEYVAAQAARGIAEVALQTGVPVIFGVLTTETAQQAWERAGDAASGPPQHAATRAAGREAARPAYGNKGYEAAQSALRMAALRDQIHK